MNRRHAIKSLLGVASAVALKSESAGRGTAAQPRSRLGMVTYALAIHRRNQWVGRHADLSPALALLEESKRLGAGGIQVDLNAADIPHLKALQQRADQYGMSLQAIIHPPKTDSEVDRFEMAIGHAKQAGINVARGVIIPGRRYERFQALEEFREFEKRGEQALERAEPLLRRHQFRLAVENHKDHRTWERLALLERLSSEYIGVCVDVGNNFALMEDSLEAVKAFAPWAFTVHLKDQALREQEEGFWLADVPLGDGFLKLPAMVSALKKANPDIRFYYETITRDPIKVPVLSDGYYSTLADTPAKELARTLHLLKTEAYPEPFPLVTKLPAKEQLALEQSGIEKSLQFAIHTLGI